VSSSLPNGKWMILDRQVVEELELANRRFSRFFGEF